MKKLAIILFALIAVNSSIMCSGVEVKAKVKSTKIVQSVKYKKKNIRKRNHINREKIRRKLTSYGMRKGMMFEGKLTVKNSSWLPPITMKYYDKCLELTKAGKDAVDDLLFYLDKYNPSDIAFNKSKYMKTFNKLQLATAADCVKLYTKKFGKYPYQELDVVSVYGHAMEFSGLVMCNIPDCRSLKDIKKNANYYRSSIAVAHEVAHQWFYNKVGSNPYKEPWLDEGFADFCENYLYQFSNTKTLKSIRKEDKKRGLYSPFEDMNYEQFCVIQKTEYEQTNKKFKGKVNWSYSDFDRYDDYSQVIYRNGAYFLNCLKTQMGNKVFFKMMRDYCNTYAFKEAATEDFLKKVYEYNKSEKVKQVVEQFLWYN